MLLIILLWVLSILGFGSILGYLYNCPQPYKFSNFISIKLAVFGIFGLAVISFLGNLANLFIPLNVFFSISIFLIGIALFIINIKKILGGFKKSELALIIVLIVYISFIPFNWALHYDTGHYYLQLVKWLRESFVPLGLANLNYLAGYNSTWFAVAAIVETPLLIRESPLFISNAIMMFFFGTASFLTFLNKTRLQKIMFSDYFIILAIIPWFVRTRSNMASMAPDLPVMLLTLFVVFMLVRAFEESENNYFYLFNSAIFSLFAVTIRISKRNIGMTATSISKNPTPP